MPISTTTSTPPAKAPAGGVLSLTQMMQLAQAAGFTGDHIAEAGAIGMAESSGRTNVVNSIKCVGLMQINQPVWVKTHPEWSISYLQNGLNNMKAAYSISKGGSNWHPWSTYQGGAYNKYLQQAKRLLPKLAGVAAGPITGGAIEAGTEVAMTGGGIPGAIDAFTETIRRTGLTYLVLVIAAVLLILGIVILLRRQAVPLVINGVTGGSGGTILKAVGKVAKAS